MLPEPLTGIASGTSKALRDFDDPSGGYTASCPGRTSSDWGGSRPLTDIWLYDLALTGGWQMWLATGDGFFSTVPTAGTLTSAWKVASGFFNNDEKADLFLYNTTSGDRSS